MKKFLFIILILSIKAYSQDISGNWKVISYEDERVYYNKITDSISFFKETVPSSKIKGLKEMLEQIAFQVTYSFDKNGKSIIDFPGKEKIVQKYEIDKDNKKIILINNEGVKDEMPFDYVDETLFLRITMEEGFIKIGLKKN